MDKRLIVLFSIVLVFAWFLWGDYSVYVSSKFAEEGKEVISKAGAWGDSYGPFTAAVSTLGTILVVMTLAAQRRAVSDQAIDFYKQRFESSFFETLKILRELRLEFSYAYSSEYQSYLGSRKGFIRINQSLFVPAAPIDPLESQRNFDKTEAVTAALIESRYHINKILPENITREDIGRIYDKWIQPRAEPTFSPYFRLVYTLLDRLDNDKVLNEEEKSYYARFLRSQFTSHELSLIAINACSVVSKDMSRLLTRFRMLKYHPESSLDTRIRRVYPPLTFQARPEQFTPKGIREILHPDDYK